MPKEPRRFGVDIRVGSPADARFLGYQESRTVEHYPALCGDKDGEGTAGAQAGAEGETEQMTPGGRGRVS